MEFQKKAVPLQCNQKQTRLQRLLKPFDTYKFSWENEHTITRVEYFNKVLDLSLLCSTIKTKVLFFIIKGINKKAYINNFLVYKPLQYSIYI